MVLTGDLPFEFGKGDEGYEAQDVEQSPGGETCEEQAKRSEDAADSWSKVTCDSISGQRGEERAKAADEENINAGDLHDSGEGSSKCG